MYTINFTLSGPTAEKISDIVGTGGKAAIVDLDDHLFLATTIVISNTGGQAAQLISTAGQDSATASDAASQGGVVIAATTGSLSLDTQRERPFDLEHMWLRCAATAGTTIGLLVQPR